MKKNTICILIYLDLILRWFRCSGSSSVRAIIDILDDVLTSRSVVRWHKDSLSSSPSQCILGEWPKAVLWLRAADDSLPAKNQRFKVTGRTHIDTRATRKKTHEHWHKVKFWMSNIIIHALNRNWWTFLSFPESWTALFRWFYCVRS